ncbi:hypothetical protein PMIN02_007660 [Paraphaeosphaeria minitans]
MHALQRQLRSGSRAEPDKGKRLLTLSLRAAVNYLLCRWYFDVVAPTLALGLFCVRRVVQHEIDTCARRRDRRPGLPEGDNRQAPTSAFEKTRRECHLPAGLGCQ